MSLLLAGVPDEASGEIPPGAVKLTEPFKQPPVWLNPAVANPPKLELTPPQAPDDPTPRADPEDRCQEGEPSTLTVPPEPRQMDRFPTGQLTLRWRVPPNGFTPAVVYEQSSRQVDLLHCARLQARRLETALAPTTKH